MDFFARQDAARRKTGLLISYYFLAVISIIGAIYLALMGIWVYNEAKETLWDPQVFISIAGIVLIIIISGSLFKIFQLQGGGARVAEMLGGTLLQPNTKDLKERQLLNIVEEMAIASGVPVPPVYLINNEMAINAFAAGFKPDAAVIGVTRGALQTLNRDELQGVIGHEFSHILNGDMGLNIKLMGVLHGILVIAIIGRLIIRSMSRRRSSSRKNDGAGAVVLFGFAMLLIGYLGVFFGNLIKAAVSRQREHLADASAVQFTRNPTGLANALKKIGGMEFGSKLESSRAEEASHMFFANGLDQAFLNLLATHPPLVERIRELDPSFDGEFSQRTFAQAEKDAMAEVAAAGVSSLAGDRAGIASVNDLAAAPEEVLATVGTVLAGHMAAAKALLAELPGELKIAAREPFGARAVIYGLLLEKKDKKVRATQLAQLAEYADPQVFRETEKLLPDLERVPATARLPLVDLSMPALRNLSREQHGKFIENITCLIEADKKIDVFEYALRHILVKHLGPQRAAKGSDGAESDVSSVSASLSRVLSVLANAGHRGRKNAGQAFAAAAGSCEGRLRVHLAFLGRDQVSYQDLDDSLEFLAQTDHQVRKSVMRACLVCLGFDQNVTVHEAELFRAIGSALDCPVPLILDEVVAGSEPAGRF